MRDDAVDTLSTDGVYESQSAKATSNFQLAHGLKDSGKFDEDTANLLLSLHSADGMITVTLYVMHLVDITLTV